MDYITKWIKDHWNGKTEFLWLITINLFFVRVMIYGLGIALETTHHLIWCGFLIVIALAFIWQFVGSYRYAKRALYRIEGVYVVFALAISFVLIWASIAWQLGERYFEITKPIDRPFVDPYVIPLQISEGGDEIYFDGPITLKMFASFDEMDTPAKLRRVVLNSEGGNVFAARGLMRLIEERGLDTYVRDKCFSACTLVFQAGVNRKADPKAEFGYHGYSYALNGSGFGVDVEEQENKDRKLFLNRGVPKAFVNRIFNTPPTELWRPSHQELRDAGTLN